MLSNLFSIVAFAEGGGTTSRNSQNSGVGRIVRRSSQQRRGNESMTSYYRRTGLSALGGSPVRLRRITPANRGNQRY